MVRIFLLIVIILPLAVSAQKKGKVEVIAKITTESSEYDCKKLELGKILFFYEPEFLIESLESKFGGSATVGIRIDENGTIVEIAGVKGPKDLAEISLKAANKVKFTQTFCDENAVAVKASLTYIFTPPNPIESYFYPKTVDGFTDIGQNSKYFEPIKDLTESYGICSGFNDLKYHEDAPLNTGEFVEFLRKTLDLLFERARISKKFPLKIGLVKPYNLNNLKSIRSVKDLDKKDPYYNSAGTLLQTYNIVFVDDDLRFRASASLTQNEVIEIWKAIFGTEALPIYFQKTDGEVVMTRGEFALFLSESMRILNYKVSA